jgi:hypothetical protein
VYRPSSRRKAALQNIKNLFPCVNKRSTHRDVFLSFFLSVGVGVVAGVVVFWC